ncbi:MAG: hypothetical protein BWK76_17715 [Desulfobulbaceae bacterium A2]|nr:MAG: hypothetical protein BWK76_17715 [Desulfobulbaceae bacterium A2]
MRLILPPLLSCLELGRPAVIGAIVRSSGSAPRNSGARMLVRPDSPLVGTIGGGELEGACIAAARELLASGAEHRLLDFNLSADEPARCGMVCGGRQQVLLHRLEPRPELLTLLRDLERALAGRLRPMLLTLLRPATPPELRLFSPQLELPGSFAAELTRRQSRASQPFILESDELCVFAEPLVHPSTVHLVGAGHVAQATARLAALVGFALRVMDDRAEFACRERFPTAEVIEVLPDFHDCLGELGADDMVVIATRGHHHDHQVLRQALRTRAGYIGMIGSRAKRDTIYAALLREGFAQTDLQRVYCPIGLKLGGDSPEEIGLCIVAQLQQVRCGIGP